MKYSIETTDNGCIEKLEFNGKTYIKEHEGDGCHLSCNNDDFWEQMEKDHVSDEVLNMVYENFDGFIAINFMEIAGREE